MKKIKDFSKVIGLVERGGFLSPSNERSEEKWNTCFERLIHRGSMRGPIPKTIPRAAFDEFETLARCSGFTVMTISRGLNR